MLFALCILGAGPQMILYTFTITMLYFLIRFIQTLKQEGWNPNKKIILYLLLGGILTIGISAIQLLPTLELSSYSIRQGGLDYSVASSHSLHPFNLVSFLMPEFYGRESYWGFWKNSSFIEGYIFLSVTALLLFLFGLYTIRNNKYFFTFGIIALFTFLFALGNYTPLYYLFWKLPLFESLQIGRASCRERV